LSQARDNISITHMILNVNNCKTTRNVDLSFVKNGENRE